MRFPILVLVLVMGLTACKSARLRKQTATQHILDLKENFLLVRLNTGEVKAAALTAAGRAEEAATFMEEQDSLNRRIREAFAAEFEFCPVYFFHAEQSAEIRKRNFRGVVFNYDRQPVDPARLAGDSFLSAEFSRIQPPASQTGLSALIVMDDSLRQLRDPFPFYVRTALLGGAQMERTAVRNLELKLLDYYAQARIWREKQALRQQRRALRRKRDR